MSNRLFVGNLPYDATEGELRDHFAQIGPVGRVFIPLDRDTGRPRGFAFVEFNAAEDAASAIAQLHQKPFKDRPLVVNEARPSESRPPAGPRPYGSPRPPGAAGPPPSARPSGPPRPPGPPRSIDSGEDAATPRRSAPAKSKRRGSGRRGFWEDGPKKEPIPEKRRGQIFGGYEEEEEEEEVSEPFEDFDDFATSLPDADED